MCVQQHTSPTIHDVFRDSTESASDSGTLLRHVSGNSRTFLLQYEDVFVITTESSKPNTTYASEASGQCSYNSIVRMDAIGAAQVRPRGPWESAASALSCAQLPKNTALWPERGSIHGLVESE